MFQIINLKNNKMENVAPEWFDENRVTTTYDAREMLSGGGHPVEKVLGDIATFKAGEIYLLITPFMPAPLIEKVKAQGFENWTQGENDSVFRNYFYKK